MNLQRPVDILKYAISTFPEATKGLAELKVNTITHNNKFIVNVSLCSNFVPDYDLKFIRLLVPVNMYPLEVSINDDDSSLHILGKRYSKIVCQNKRELCETLDKIFLSQHFTNNVKNLVTWANYNKAIEQNK